MQVSGRHASRCRKGIAGLVVLFTAWPAILLGQSRAADFSDVTQIARRAYFVGTSAEVRDKVTDQTMGHTTQIGQFREQAEFYKPPPACGIRTQRVFSDFCTSRLKVALTPCHTSVTSVLCSTNYLEPASERTFWRLRYRHLNDQVSLELEVLRRSPTGRPEPGIDRTNELEELFEQLLIAIRCEDNS